MTDLTGFTTDSNASRNNADNADNADDADNPVTGRLAYEAYEVTDDTLTVLNNLIEWVSDEEYGGDDLPEGHPIFVLYAELKDKFSGEGSFGNAVGDGDMTRSEFNLAVSEYAVGCTTLADAHPSVAEGTDADGELLIPVVGDKPLSLDLWDEETASDIADAFNEWADAAMQDDTPLPDSAGDATDAESEEEDGEDDNPLKNEWKNEDADDEGDVGDATDTDAGSDNDPDLTQKEAVYETLATADSAVQRAVIDSINYYRHMVQDMVQGRHGMKVKLNYAGKQARNWADVADVDVEGVEYPDMTPYGADETDETDEADEADEADAGGATDTDEGDTPNLNDLPADVVADMTPEQIEAFQSGQ